MKHIVLRVRLLVALLTLLLVFYATSLVPTAHAQAMDLPIFEQGSYGPVVEQIQAWLNQWGYHLPIDGKYGPKTDQVIRSFQASHGLQVDGAVGDQTWGKLIIPLRIGSCGSAVTALQKYLQVLPDYPAVAVDGVYGPQTEAAVEAFQHQTNQKTDGIAGFETWHAIILTELD